MPKTAVIIPAYNEEKLISGVLKSSLEWRKKDPKNRVVVVVDDGSKDRTAETALKAGAVVLHSDGSELHKEGKNMGKGEAVRMGVIHAASQGCSVVVTLDADLLPFKSGMIEGLVRHLNKSKADMVVARMDSEGRYSRYSGQRAIRISALKDFIRGVASWKELAQGKGLEEALNHLVPKKVESRFFFGQKRDFVVSREAEREMIRTFGLIERRKASAKKLVDTLQRRRNDLMRHSLRK